MTINVSFVTLDSNGKPHKVMPSREMQVPPRAGESITIGPVDGPYTIYEVERVNWMLRDRNYCVCHTKRMP